MDKTIGVSEARKNLMQLTKHVSETMSRLILTNKGRGETVLLSLSEYRSLNAAAQLAMSPAKLQDMLEGFAELEKGRGVRLAEAATWVDSDISAAAVVKKPGLPVNGKVVMVKKPDAKAAGGKPLGRLERAMISGVIKKAGKRTRGLTSSVPQEV